MQIVVTNVKSPTHRGVIEHLTQDAGFGESAVVWSAGGATIYVGTVQARSDAGIPESELFGLIGKIVILGATVQRSADGLSVNLDSSILEHGTDAHPAKPFIYNRFGKVE